MVNMQPFGNNMFIKIFLKIFLISFIINSCKSSSVGNSSSFIETVNNVSFKMILVEGGQFKMGSEDDFFENEKNGEIKTISNFYMCETEVTEKLWYAVMLKYHNEDFLYDCYDCPVEDVSWNEIQVFLERLNKLTKKKFVLPSEAQWEYAAGGGSLNRTEWAGTNSEDELIDYAWCKSNSGNKRHKVGTKKPNNLGLFDMSGNVSEWCEDDWHSPGSGGPANGSAWIDSPRASSAVVRNGSWFLFPYSLRVIKRTDWPKGESNMDFGFRLALNL